MPNRTGIPSFGWGVVSAVLGAALSVSPPVASTPWWARLVLVGVFAALGIAAYRAQQREQERAEKEAAASQAKIDALRTDLEVAEQAQVQRDEAHTVLMHDMLGQFQHYASVMERHIRLIERGAPPNSPQIAELVESAKVSAATIQGIVAMPLRGVFQITGHPPSVNALESATPGDKKE